MRIELAKHAGFCPGVRLAVEAAHQACDQDEDITWMLGEIVHNKHVVNELTSKGLKLAHNIEEIPEKSRVIIRAHGVAPQVISELQSKNCEIIDQTCPFVVKVQLLAAEAAAKGSGLIITGNPEHPEVKGLVGHYGAKPVIIDSISAAETAIFPAGEWMLVSQTTFSASQFHVISAILKKKIAKLRIFDTICVTAENRQEEASDLAKRSDIILVLGSSTSSNTMKLVEVCTSHCSKVYLIENSKQLRNLLERENFTHKKIGITAGASTPQGMIREVIHKMKEQEGLVAQEEKETALTHQPQEEQESSETAEFAEATAETEAETAELEATAELNDKTAEKEVEAVKSETTAEFTEETAETEAETVESETTAEFTEDTVETEAEPVETETAAEAEVDATATDKEDDTTREEVRAEAEESTEETEAAAVPETEQQDQADVSFSDFIDNIPQLKRGSIVTGIVVRQDENYVYVDVKDKSEGRIPLKEFENDPEYDLEAAVKNHAELEVYVRNIRNTDMGKEITLSKARVDFSKHKAQIEKAFNEKTPVQVKVINVVRDGVICSYGSVDIYVHRTQLELHVVDDLEPYRGETFEILITQFDADRKRPKVAGSRRSLLQRERRRKAEELWDNIEIDKFYTGIVRNLTNFGAFVDIGGVDGLVHISELSWKRIKHPSEVVNVGDKIEVFVKDFDREAKRISLGYRLPENDPYLNIEEKFPIGSIVRGIVVRMFQFGAFVEIAPGVDALCHISQISDYRLNRPNDVLEVGMEIDARVLEVSNETRRISISIREVEPINPSEEVLAEIEARQQRRREQREEKQPQRGGERRERRSRGRREDRGDEMPTSYVDKHTPTSMGDLANISAVTDGGAELLDKIMGDKVKTAEEEISEHIEGPVVFTEKHEPNAEMADVCCQEEGGVMDEMKKKAETAAEEVKEKAKAVAGEVGGKPVKADEAEEKTVEKEIGEHIDGPVVFAEEHEPNAEMAGACCQEEDGVASEIIKD